MCPHYITGSVAPIALPTQSMDLSSVRIAPGVSVSGVFQHQTPSLVSIIATDPIGLAGQFSAVNLIPSSLVDALNSQYALPATDKATQIVTALHTCIKTSANDSVMIMKICEVLQKQQTVVVDQVLTKILNELTGSKIHCTGIL